ncbi:HS12B-like protein [Mya arenaria]|uniref:HS12B-like protein n=1 Tax=Mya arenaria TaxID=6604 RepID=A0ABY7DNY8_MYAAR|nr:HS12B-like protein [Mya arenaria]
MAELQSEHVLVVAIDFGTTYSGYAFSSGVEFEKDPTKISSNKPWIASQGLVSHKTPTCVLLNPDGTFKNFGYQAEDKYNEIAADDSQDHSQFYFFRRFKMVLHTRAHLNREVTVEDETGKSMKAIDVFAHGIRFLKNHALETINIQGLQIDEMDIHWVITVPAIWSDGAKQFMREAAQKAGVEENNLSIALEPEAASVYCKYLPIHQLGQDASGGCFLPGAKYMVIDLGGGTADITVHKVEGDGSLCEVHGPSGGAWGGTKVDQAFMRFVTEIFGEDVMRDFKKNNMEDAIDLHREFELRKRSVKMDSGETTSMAIKIPVALYELYEDKHGKRLRDDMKNSPKFKSYRDKITCTADKMKINIDLMKTFFKRPLEDLYMQVGQPTKVGQSITSLPLSVRAGQQQARVRIFASKNSCPCFVTDEGCSYLGEILVDVPEMEFDEGGTIEVQMTFGGTELHVEALEKKSKQMYKSRFDFLSGN